MNTDENEILDLRGVLCPLNFVKIKLALETMREGERFDAFLDPGRPMIEVPRSLKAEGHRIIKSERRGEGIMIIVEKGP